MKPSLLAALLATATLIACSQPAPPPASSAAEVPAEAAAAAPASIQAPAGTYQLDPTHSSLSLRVNHLGLSNYVSRFTRYDVVVVLDPSNLAASSVTATIDPKSIRTDYQGDYKASHADSRFQSWDEDLSMSDKFLNAGQHAQIEFRSTRVEQTGPNGLRVTGELQLLGQTHPVTLEVKVVGSAAQHPFTKQGAVGFSATGTFNRSEFGMNHLLKPLLVGDAVTIQFEGEFAQAAPAPAG